MPLAPLPFVRAQVVEVSRRLHYNGWVANHDGNVSVRLKGGRLLITPTAFSKRDVDDLALLVVDLDGQLLEGRHKPFSELELHLAIYRARPEVDAVIHAHPPHATALGLVGLELGPVAMPEVVVSLGERIPTLPRAMPRDSAGVEAVHQAAKAVDAMLCQGNGALTCGPTLELALLRMELVEHYAKIVSIARGLGTVPPLPEASVHKLLSARAKAGLGPRNT